jgi:hypothetical protein
MVSGSGIFETSALNVALKRLPAHRNTCPDDQYKTPLLTEEFLRPPG